MAPSSDVRRASYNFCAAVRGISRRPVEMTLTRLKLLIPLEGTIRLSDERIGDEPYCYWKLSGTPGPLWIWNPDLLKGGRLLPIYEIRGAAP